MSLKQNNIIFDISVKDISCESLSKQHGRRPYRFVSNFTKILHDIPLELCLHDLYSIWTIES